MYTNFASLYGSILTWVKILSYRPSALNDNLITRALIDWSSLLYQRTNERVDDGKVAFKFLFQNFDEFDPK